MNRIEVFRKMLESDPQNTTVRFGLANELIKSEQYEDAISELQVYLGQTDDQGAAYGMLARALERLDRTDEARAAYQQGIEAARRHNHPGMAQEYELAMAELI
ncbi:MAG TPA: tetratricopeptide repeat protein [Blastocatellia bacterium]|nr:tetratricopeptide repeat protein [Blastocatellia bacterium]